MRATKTILAALALTACAWGCIGAQNQEVDYYSQVVGVCDYRISGGSQIVFEESEITKTTLTPECKAALEGIIPYDETWNTAPAGLKDKTTEAFQVILAYPLKMPPDYRILGLADTKIPVDHRCIFGPELDPQRCLRDVGANAVEQNDHPNMAKNIFNYVLNKIDNVTYRGSDPSTVAQYMPTIEHGREMRIFDLFWAPDVYTNLVETPFIRASTVIHEARHGDGNVHAVCNGVAACDPELGGSYGIEVSYLTMLVHGSATVKGSDGKPILSDLDLGFFASDQCYSGQARFQNEPQGFKDLTTDPDGCGGVDWLLAHEGLTAARAALSAEAVSAVAAAAASKAMPLRTKQNCGTHEEDLKNLDSF